MKKRLPLLLALSVLGMLIVLAIWLGWPQERLLMEVARPVLKVDVEKTTLCWLSLHRLLLVTTEREPSWVANGNGSFIPENWKGAANVFDTTSHITDHLTGLTRQLNDFPEGPPGRFELSPDGDWLLWETAGYGDGWPHPHAAHLDGTHYRTWFRNRDEDKFFLDSHRLVQMNKYDPTVVRDLLNPKNDRQYKTVTQTTALIAPYVVQHPVFVTVSDSDEVSITDVAFIDTYRTQDRLQRIRSEGNEWKDAPKPIQTWKLSLSQDYLTQRTIFQHAAVSSQQQSVCYCLTISRLHPVLVWLKHIFPRFAPNPTWIQELWCVRADGHGKHKIGVVPLDANPGAALKDVRWLPDGKQISFIYRGTLYVVPADPGK